MSAAEQFSVGNTAVGALIGALVAWCVSSIFYRRSANALDQTATELKVQARQLEQTTIALIQAMEGLVSFRSIEMKTAGSVALTLFGPPAAALAAGQRRSPTLTPHPQRHQRKRLLPKTPYHGGAGGSGGAGRTNDGC